MFSFLVSLAISFVFTAISILLAPRPKTSGATPEPGALASPTADEGSPIPHVRGTRFVSVNCLWWQPEGTKEVKQ